MPTEFAPAKINLTLHVTGQREDGYHLLDSLVMFADTGDLVEVVKSDASSLSVIGPEAAGVPSDTSNSILKTAHLQSGNATFRLTKNLPSSAGIGGGTADAAAAFRAMNPDTSFDPATLTPEDIAALTAQAEKLGADVPVCLFSKTAHMQGIGEDLTFYPDLPPLHAVLVNPRIPVSTPDVFQALKSKKNSPMPPIPGHFGKPDALIAWLAEQRNDLQRPAVTLFPEIGYTLRALEYSNGCKLARMSGSGATCFGLYETERFAQFAATRLAQLHPDWWVKSCILGG